MGNNTFVYCGNNPVNRCDASGKAWEYILAGAAAAAVSGVANGISTAHQGGSIRDCLIAGGIGALGGAAGFAVAATAKFTPLGNVAGRVTATAITDIGTAWALEGKIADKDIVYTAVDAVMDACLSPIGYFYNPIEDIVPQTIVNSVVDGIIDFAETYLIFSDHTSYMPSKSGPLTMARV